MTSTIDTAFQELISKVEESQYIIDDLKMQVERLKLKLKSQNKLQEELEYYFLLSQNQLEILKENEVLRARAVALLASLTN